MKINVIYAPQFEQIEVTPIWDIYNEPKLTVKPLY